jgi:predicted Zn-dependent peptidase
MNPWRPRDGGAPGTVSRGIRKQVLDNGLTLLTEQMEAFRSVCLGVWLRRGSRDETQGENGVTHFIEHLVFKGTENRSAKEIAKILDLVGGHSDAFTTKEYTCFYAKVLDQHLEDAVDLLADIVLRPRFEAEEIEKERKVIFEEIRMVEDTAEELLYDLFLETVWGEHPLGLPIQGTHESVSALGREAILDYFRRSYRSGNLILSAAGHLDHGELAERVERAFGSLPQGAGSQNGTAPAYHRAVVLREKGELEQLHLCVGVPAFPLSDRRRHAGFLLNTILGGSMSSRLFQAVREDRGLAYSVYSSLPCFVDTGCLMVYLATAPEQAREAVDVVMEELRGFRRDPVEHQELQDAKEHVKGSLVLGLESSSSRMSNLARQEIYFGRQSSMDELVADIDAVTVDQVHDLAGELFGGGSASMAVVGRVSDSRLSKEQVRF